VWSMGCVQSAAALFSRRRYDAVTAVDSTPLQPQPSRRRHIIKKRLVPQHEFLSDDEKELIADTWRRLANDPVGIGIDVFLRIFQLAPAARRAFPSLNSLSDSQTNGPKLLTFKTDLRVTLIKAAELSV